MVMSSEEEESGEDFVGSESDWEPEGNNKEDVQEDSESNDDFERSIPAAKRKRISLGGCSGTMTKSTTPSRSAPMTLRGRRRRASATITSLNESLGTHKLELVTDKKPVKMQKGKTKKSIEDSDSDSSGDDYLVPTEKLNLASDFYNVKELAEKSVDANMEEPPNFDCNQGLKLSDSDDDEDEENIESNMNTIGGDRLKTRMENRESDEDPILGVCKNTSDDTAAQNKLANLCKYLENFEAAKSRVKEHSKQKQEEMDKMNISNLLALGEGISGGINSKTSSNKKKLPEWEDVPEKREVEYQPTIGENGLEVTVKFDGRNKETDLEAMLRRKINRAIRENQYILHQVSLLCHIAHGIYCNKVLNDTKLMGAALKLLPNKTCYPSGRSSIKYFEAMIKWYKTALRVMKNSMYSNFRTLPPLSTSLALQIQSREAICKKDFVLIFVILLRAMGMQCRMVLNLTPLPIRPSQNDLCTSKKSKETQKKKQASSKKKTSRKKNVTEKTTAKIPETVTTKIENPRPIEKGESSKSNASQRESKKNVAVTKSQNPDTKTNNKKAKEKNINTTSNETVAANKVSQKEKNKQISATTRVTRQTTKRAASPQEIYISPHFLKKNKNIDENTATNPKVPEKKETIIQLDGGHDDDFYFDFHPIKTFKSSKKYLEESQRRKVLSSDDDDEVWNKKKNTNMDIWVEVYCEEEERWICIDIFNQKVHDVDSVRKSATSPVAYVFAFNNDNTLKDVSPRYCPNWNTIIRKLRVDQDWLDEAIWNYKSKPSQMNKAEDREFRRLHSQKPLPTTISEYKNHPLYVLERHLLKFEAIYPSNIPPLGYVRGEPVYPRSSVHVLHSKDIWLKQARVIKPGESGYKIVKSRPKWDKNTQSVIRDQPLEIFGYWQTKDFEPPVAKDGIVPKNSYGNVELFKKRMLPIGTVHLDLPGLHRVCKKLNVDFAPAVVGFDFHQGLCHPQLEGIVVCKEYSDLVVSGWEEERAEMERKEKQKTSDRALQNWKKLIKGMLIKRKLQKKYNFADVPSGSGSNVSKAPKRRRN